MCANASTDAGPVNASSFRPILTVEDRQKFSTTVGGRGPRQQRLQLLKAFDSLDTKAVA
eukprot:m.175126 g.175126  ORF g.175126 m.175126 type:complete len:59 (+) comp16768_c0_seq3:492-668(+)